MSGIANIYNVPVSAPEYNMWAFAHAAHHQDIIRRIYELSNIALPEYILDPMDPSDPGVWIYQHQLMHNQLNALLGVTGFNLTSVNWENEELKNGFIFLNATEHKRYADLLGIG